MKKSIALMAPILLGAFSYSANASETGLGAKLVNKEDLRPIQVIVSRADQSLQVFKGAERIATSPVSTGKRGHTTPTGVFSILEKRRRHFSNLYDNAPMPFMQRLTWSGIALHASNHVPRYPASHGCVRLPNSFAKTLFSLTERGAHVVIAEREVAPKPIQHQALFQPGPDPRDIKPTGETDDQGLEMRLINRHALSLWQSRQAQLAKGKKSPKPIRILITRRSNMTLVRDIQSELNQLGYDAGKVDGLAGRNTIAAVRHFMKEQDKTDWNGKFDRPLLQALYSKAGKGQVPDGHIYVRQKFKPVFNAPLRFKQPQKPLGAHLFTVSKTNEDNRKAHWLALSLGDSIHPTMQKRVGIEAIDQDNGLIAAESVLDRLIIPQEIRDRIAPMLVAGSSLAISDKGKSRETTYQGTDFIVLTKPKGPDQKKKGLREIAKRN
ncbi:MAG: L,D-transpeptidase family protein [Cohaesibacter sp.]|nr:L,D-transpeptidase family protein [Cohaesibacter sp.]